MWRMSGRYYDDYKHMVFNLKAKKCNLFQPRARYLEMIVTADGYTMDPADEAAVLALKEAKPSTVGALRKLLGIISYYRQYIKDFSRLPKPIYDVLSCSDLPRATSTKTRGTAKHPRGQVLSNHAIIWTDNN